VNKAASFFIAMAAVAGLIVILAVFAHDYAMAPAIVPTHFGVLGAPDAWGPRSTFIIFPAIATVIAVASVALWVFGMPSQPGRPDPPPVVSLLVMLVLAESTWMLVLAEIGVASFEPAKRRHPERVVNVGIREQLMVGVASGLALTGFRPIIHTIASFAVERPYEQLKIDLGHQDVGAVVGPPHPERYGLQLRVDHDPKTNGPLPGRSSPTIANPALCVLFSGCVCAPKLPSRAFSRRVSDKRSGV